MGTSRGVCVSVCFKQTPRCPFLGHFGTKQFRRSAWHRRFSSQLRGMKWMFNVTNSDPRMSTMFIGNREELCLVAIITVLELCARVATLAIEIGERTLVLRIVNFRRKSKYSGL
jgi:hypothetical protein